MSQITVIIPHRSGESTRDTVESLRVQTFQDFITCEVCDTENLGANHTRNEGFRLSPKSEFTLFSDDDIIWKPDALQTLLDTLQSSPCAAYSYGSYDLEGHPLVGKAIDFDAQALIRGNYISTMSLIRTKYFTGFDEAIERLQDWDLWLSFLVRGLVGVYCGKTIFTTKVRNGISFGERAIPIVDGMQIVLDKYVRALA
jgi:hypothetical protein